MTTSHSPSPTTLGRVLKLAHEHRRPATRFTAALVLLTVLVSLIWRVASPQYVATASVTMLPSRLEIGYTNRRSDLSALNPAMVLSHTHTEYLLSRTLADDVAQALAAEGEGVDRPNVLVRALRATAGGARNLVAATYAVLNYGQWKPLPAAERLARRIQRSTAVQPAPGSYVLRISVGWDSPQVAARAANLITERYAGMMLESAREELKVARRYIEERIAESSRQLNDIEARIESYKQKTGVYAGSRDVAINLEALSRYQQDYTTAQAQLQELATRIDSLKAYQTPAALAADEAQRAGLEARKQSLEAAVQEQVAKLGTYPTMEREMLDLYRDKTDCVLSLNALKEKLLQARIAEAVEVSAVRVIDAARPPLYPQSPKILWNAAAALCAGLLLSGAYALAMESRRGS